MAQANVYIDSETEQLVAEARELNLNLSEAFRIGIQYILEEAKGTYPLSPIQMKMRIEKLVKLVQELSSKISNEIR